MVVKTLLSSLSRDQINIQDDHGETPLHLAYGPQAIVEIVHHLIAAGAGITIKNRWVVSLLQASERFGDTAIAKAMTMESRRKLIVRATSTTSKMPLFEALLRQVAGLDIPACFCDMCLVLVAAQSACGQNNSVQLNCACSNHVRMFLEDTMSRKSRNSDFVRLCPCMR